MALLLALSLTVSSASGNEMEYREALKNFRRQLEVSQVEEPSVKRGSFVSPLNIPVPQDTRTSEDILSISRDWVSQVKQASAEVKASLGSSAPKKSGGFAEGLAKSDLFDPTPKEISEMDSEEKKTALIKRRESPSAYAPERPKEAAARKGALEPASNKASPGYGGITSADIEVMIEEEAKLRGIDPSVAKRIFRAEGKGSYQSQIARSGKGSINGKEASYGPYQLYTGGGLGNQYEKSTGRDLTKDNTREGIRNQVAFSLDAAVDSGWTPWYGRKPAGVGVRDGLEGAKKVGNWS